jgi:hypothetical protein
MRYSQAVRHQIKNIVQEQQLLHLMLLPAVRVEHKRGRAGITTQVVGATEVEQQVLDVELGEDMISSV